MKGRIEEQREQGLLFVLSGPSGVGKGAVCKELLAQNPRLVLSVSVTSRDPRPGEVDGQSYYFRTTAEFEEMVRAGRLLEWARVYGHYYGTPRLPVEETLAGGGDVLLEIDIQGAFKVKEAFPESILVFIAPPSEEEILARLTGRGSEDAPVIAARMACLADEMKFLSRYDYAVVNDTVARAAATVAAVIKAEHARAARWRGYSGPEGR